MRPQPDTIRLAHAVALLRPVLILLAFLFIAMPGTADAQSDPVEAIRTSAQDIQATINILDRLDDAAGRDDESLAGARFKFQDALSRSNDVIRQIDEQSQLITDRLNEIGPPPEDGTVEAPAVADTRAELNSQKAALAVIKTDLEKARRAAQDAISQITRTRQEVFTDAISRRTELNRATIDEAVSGISSLWASARAQLVNWFAFVVNERRWQAIGTALVSLAVALFLSVNLNRFFGRYLERSNYAHPDYFTRVFTSFWVSVLPSLATAIFLAAAYLLSQNLGLLPGIMDRIFLSIAIAIGGLVFAWNLCRAVYAPDNPQFRLAPLTDTSARQLFLLTLMLFAVYAFDSVFSQVNAALSGPLALTALQGLIASVLIAFILFLMGAFIRFDGNSTAPDASTRQAAGTAPAADDQAEQVSGLAALISRLMARGRAVKLVRFLLFLSAVVILVAGVFGYIGFARFIAQQIVVTGAIVAAMIVGILASRELSREGVLASTRFGRLMLARGTEPHRVEQMSLVAGILLLLAVLLAGIPAILLQWGTQVEEIWIFFQRIFTGIDVGNIRISLSGILIGLTIFAIILLLTRFFQRWLTRSVFSRSKIDQGVSDSIRAGVGYVGFGIAGLLAITSAGFDLSSLAIVAGALSLGIGFGLQNVVSNFVSGLILLVERPIKVGDWIVVGQAEGTVRRISVRATEIETFQRQSIIVPNSELINSQVGNWTFKSKSGRIDIPVGIAYGSDVRLAERILYEIAHEHAMVAKKPEPSVWFVGFGDFSLDFRLRMFLYDINNLVTVESEVRFAILERFKEAGIEIPFPQRNLNLRIEGDASGAGSELAKALAHEAETEGPNVRRRTAKPGRASASRKRSGKTQPG